MGIDCEEESGLAGKRVVVGSNDDLVRVAGVDPLVNEDTVITFVGDNQEELTLLGDGESVGDDVEAESDEGS